MCTATQLSEISRTMIEVYRSVYGSDVISIYLYGSYARGDNDSESDIDMAAVVKGDRLSLQNKLKKVWDISADLSLEHDVIISPTVIPYEEFEEYKNILPYYRNIEREGRRIG